MIETLLVTLIVAAITGLCILAYRHPAAYAKLYFPLILIGCVVLAGVVLWNAALDLSELSISRLEIPSEYMAEIRSTLGDRKLPYMWSFLVFLAYNSLLAFLMFLPILLNDK